MKIKFDEIGLSVLPSFKGGEKALAANMFFDGTNRIFRGTLAPGASIGLHTHDDSCEVIFILVGNGTLTEEAAEPQDRTYSHADTAGRYTAPAKETDLESMTIQSVEAGDCLYCPKGHTHSLKNTDTEKDLVFYAVVARQ